MSRLYQTYLAATWAERVLTEAGAEVSYISFRHLDGVRSEYRSNERIAEEFFTDNSWYHADLLLTIQHRYNWPDGRADDLHVEEVTDRLLSATSAQLFRDSGEIYVLAEAHDLLVTFQLGTGVCERVKVGERWVPPAEGYYQPIYEVHCGDPLAVVAEAEEALR